MKPEIELALNEAAEDCMGIYPQSMNGKKRTEWQNGWNEAIIKLTKLKGTVHSWFITLSEEHQNIVGDLLIRDKLDVQFHKEKMHMYVNCNDVFAWGCADAEDISLDELKRYQQLSKTKWGDVKWVCIKRNEKPQYPMIWDMHKDGEWDEQMEALPDNYYNKKIGWDQTPTKPWREEDK